MLSFTLILDALLLISFVQQCEITREKFTTIVADSSLPLLTKGVRNGLMFVLLEFK